MKECNQCGKCCTYYGKKCGFGSVENEQIQLWKNHAPYILDYVDIYDYGDDISNGDIWVDQEEGDELNFCPWLREEEYKCYCQIYEYRPKVCRQFPIDVDQMRQVDCEMLELSDIKKSDEVLMNSLNELRNK